MVKIFESKYGKHYFKLNIVDHLNNFIGYDFTKDCCENFGYEVVPKNLLDDEKSSKNYIIDDFYFEIKESPLDYANNKLIVKIKDEISNEIVGKIILFNEHNTYYYHFGEIILNNKKEEFKL